MAPSSAHLLRRADTYYFRRAIPLQLLEKFGRRELKFSLKTMDRDIANIRCRHFTNMFDLLIRGIEQMGDVTREQIKELVRTYFLRQWQKANDDYWCVKRGGWEILYIGKQWDEFIQRKSRVSSWNFSTL